MGAGLSQKTTNQLLNLDSNDSTCDNSNQVHENYARISRVNLQICHLSGELLASLHLSPCTVLHRDLRHEPMELIALSETYSSDCQDGAGKMVEE